MKLDTYKLNGSKDSSVNADKTVFGIKANQSVVHQAVNAELTNLRQGTHSSKNRANVRGGGKKPFKQKGRGGARAGTIRSPLWKGGGTVFGPSPHDYSLKMPKKMRNLARRSVLSNHFANKTIKVLEDFTIENPKTGLFVKILKKLDLIGKKITILSSVYSENLYLSTRNIPNIYVVNALNASTYDIIDCEILLIDKAAIELLNSSLGIKP
tara:strand:- start:176 stop:808 length:633 start_codon:yes stop_codon:yes gene_type:complete